MIVSLYEFLSGFTSRFNKMEATLKYVLKKVDGEEGPTSAPQRPPSPDEADEEETVRSLTGPISKDC